VIALQPGSSSPLGATVVEGGVNFAVFSAHDDIWHGFLPAARAGLIYGFRANGRYAPDEGHRFNANKLLLDPYARSWHGNMQWHDSVYGYQRGHEDGHYSFDSRDSAPYVPKSVVVETMAKAAQPTCLKNAVPSP